MHNQMKTDLFKTALSQNSSKLVPSRSQYSNDQMICRLLKNASKQTLSSSDFLLQTITLERKRCESISRSQRVLRKLASRHFLLIKQSQRDFIEPALPAALKARSNRHLMVNPSASKWHRSTCLLKLEAVNAKNRIDRKRKIKQLFARSLCPPISSLKQQKTLLLRNLHLNLSILRLLRGLKVGNEQVCQLDRQHFKNHRLLHLRRPKCQTSVTRTMA